MNECADGAWRANERSIKVPNDVVLSPVITSYDKVASFADVDNSSFTMRVVNNGCGVIR